MSGDKKIRCRESVREGASVEGCGERFMRRRWLLPVVEGDWCLPSRARGMADARRGDHADDREEGASCVERHHFRSTCS